LHDQISSSSGAPFSNAGGPPQGRDSQQYLQYQRDLISLHRETGIPPTIKRLNDEVMKTSELAVAGGTYSDIWIGVWLGEEKVRRKFHGSYFTHDNDWPFRPGGSQIYKEYTIIQRCDEEGPSHRTCVCIVLTPSAVEVRERGQNVGEAQAR